LPGTGGGEARGDGNQTAARMFYADAGRAKEAKEAK
jgi:hypothetical protein